MSKLVSKLSRQIMAAVLSVAMILPNMTVYATEGSVSDTQEEITVGNDELNEEQPSLTEETESNEGGEDETLPEYGEADELSDNEGGGGATDATKVSEPVSVNFGSDITAEEKGEGNVVTSFKDGKFTCSNIKWNDATHGLSIKKDSTISFTLADNLKAEVELTVCNGSFGSNYNTKITATSGGNPVPVIQEKVKEGLEADPDNNNRYAPIFTVLRASGEVTITIGDSGQGYLHAMDVKITTDNRYALDVATVDNGTAAADVKTAKKDDVVTLTATPDSGYELETWSVKKINANGTVSEETVAVNVDGTDSNKATFTMPDADVQITPSFKAGEGVDPTKVSGPVSIDFVNNFTDKDSSNNVTSFGTGKFTCTGVTWNSGGHGLYLRKDKNAAISFTLADGLKAEVELTVCNQYGSKYTSTITATSGSNAVPVIQEKIKEGLEADAQNDNRYAPIFTVLRAAGQVTIKFNDGETYLHAMEVKTTQADRYALNIATVDSGAATADKEKFAKVGDIVTLTATPDSGYELETWSVTYKGTDANGEETTETVEVTKSTTDANVATFTMPAADVQITPSFKAGSGVDPTKVSGNVSVNFGSDITADEKGEGNVVTSFKGGKFTCSNIKWNDEQHGLSIKKDSAISFTLADNLKAEVELLVCKGNGSNFNTKITATSNGKPVPVIQEKTNAAVESGAPIFTVLRASGEVTITIGDSGQAYLHAMDVKITTDNRYALDVATVENGAATADKGKTAKKDDIVTLTAAPADGYKLGDANAWTVKKIGADGEVSEETVAVTADGTDPNKATFTMPEADVQITPSFVPVGDMHNIKIAPAAEIENGTVTGTTKTQAPATSTVKLSDVAVAEPANGYRLKAWKVTYEVTGEDETKTVTPVTVTPEGDDDYKFRMPDADVTISAEFEVKPVEYFYSTNFTALTGYTRQDSIKADKIEGFEYDGKLVFWDASHGAYAYADLTMTLNLKEKTDITVTGCAYGAASVKTEMTATAKVKKEGTTDEFETKDLVVDLEEIASETGNNGKKGHKFIIKDAEGTVTLTLTAQDYIHSITVGYEKPEVLEVNPILAGKYDFQNPDSEVNINDYMVIAGLEDDGKNHGLHAIMGDATIKLVLSAPAEITVDGCTYGNGSMKASSGRRVAKTSFIEDEAKNLSAPRFTVLNAQAGNVTLTFDNNMYVHSITIAYDAVDKYLVEVSAEGNGKASSDKELVTVGETITLTAEPRFGSRLKEWVGTYKTTGEDGNETVNNVTVTMDTTDSNKATFTMPAADVEVKAVFEETQRMEWDFLDTTDTTLFGHEIKEGPGTVAGLQIDASASGALFSTKDRGEFGCAMVMTGTKITVPVLPNSKVTVFKTNDGAFKIGEKEFTGVRGTYYNEGTAESVEISVTDDCFIEKIKVDRIVYAKYGLQNLIDTDKDDLENMGIAVNGMADDGKHHGYLTDISNATITLSLSEEADISVLSCRYNTSSTAALSGASSGEIKDPETVTEGNPPSNEAKKYIITGAEAGDLVLTFDSGMYIHNVYIAYKSGDPDAVSFTTEPSFNIKGNPHPNSILRVSYELDKDGEDTSTIEWYTVDGEDVRPITDNKNSKTYTVQSSDIGKSIRAVVTPDTTLGNPGEPKSVVSQPVTKGLGEGKGLELILEKNEYTYTGSAIIPEYSVTYDGEALVEGVDYTVRCTNNIKVSTDRSQAKITVTGKGNLSGNTFETFKITKKSLAKDDTAGAGAVQGDTVVVVEGTKASPVLIYNGVKLGTRDFEFVDKNDKTKKWKKNELPEGGATIALKATANGNFDGTRTLDVKVVDKNNKASLVVDISDKRNRDLVYNGDVVRPYFKVTNKNGDTLTSEDYIISFPSEEVTSAGRKSFTVTGISEKCVGTVTKTYTVKPAPKTGTFTVKLDNEDILTTVPELDFVSTGVVFDTSKLDVTYVTKAADSDDEIPLPLKYGCDYTITYSGNKRVGNTAKFTITGQGNYKGVRIQGKFTIKGSKLSLDEGSANGTVEVIVPDKVFNGKKMYKSVPCVIEKASGTVLPASNYKVEYWDNEDATTKMTKAEEAGKVVWVTITGKGGYAVEGSVVKASYTVKAGDPKKDLSTATIKLYETADATKAVTSMKYTGAEVTPAKIVITLKDRTEIPIILDETAPAYASDANKAALAKFDIKYVNNTNKGRASIIITSEDDETCVGGKTVNFTIAAKPLRGFAWLKWED